MDRKALSQILFDYLNPLLPNYGDSEALLYLAGGGAQYEDEAIPMEAWARPLWGLAPYWAGGSQSAGGTFERIYCDGLIAGTDPQSGAYWGDCRDHDQKFVEMAAIAYALLLAPNVLWEPLSDGQRERAAAWLGKLMITAALPVTGYGFRRSLTLLCASSVCLIANKF